jgi:hypothetical protein
MIVEPPKGLSNFGFSCELEKIDDDASKEVSKTAAFSESVRNLRRLELQQFFTDNSKESDSKESASVWEHLETHLDRMKLGKIQIEMTKARVAAALFTGDSKESASVWEHLETHLDQMKLGKL